MAETLVVQSKVRALAKQLKCRFSGDAVDELSKLVAGAIKKASERAKGNKRQTIKASDI